MDLRLCKKIMFRAFRKNWRTFESEEKIRSNHPVINYFLIWSGPMGGFSFLPFFSAFLDVERKAQKKAWKTGISTRLPYSPDLFLDIFPEESSRETRWTRIASFVKGWKRRSI